MKLTVASLFGIAFSACVDDETSNLLESTGFSTCEAAARSGGCGCSTVQNGADADVSAEDIHALCPATCGLCPVGDAAPAADTDSAAQAFVTAAAAQLTDDSGYLLLGGDYGPATCLTGLEMGMCNIMPGYRFEDWVWFKQACATTCSIPECEEKDHGTEYYVEEDVVNDAGDSMQINLARSTIRDGVKILLLHGFPGSSYQMVYYLAPHIKAAIPAAEIIIPDLRGTNRTMPRFERTYFSNIIEGTTGEDHSAYHYTSHESDMEALIERILGIDRLTHDAHAYSGEQVYIIGHDYGGQIAWALAADRPELVAGVITLNGPQPFLYGAASVFDSTCVDLDADGVGDICGGQAELSKKQIIDWDLWETGETCTAFYDGPNGGLQTNAGGRILCDDVMRTYREAWSYEDGFEHQIRWHYDMFDLRTATLQEDGTYLRADQTEAEKLDFSNPMLILESMTANDRQMPYRAVSRGLNMPAVIMVGLDQEKIDPMLWCCTCAWIGEFGKIETIAGAGHNLPELNGATVAERMRQIISGAADDDITWQTRAECEAEFCSATGTKAIPGSYEAGKPTGFVSDKDRCANLYDKGEPESYDRWDPTEFSSAGALAVVMVAALSL